MDYQDRLYDDLMTLWQGSLTVAQYIKKCDMSFLFMSCIVTENERQTFFSLKIWTIVYMDIATTI